MNSSMTLGPLPDGQFASFAYDVRNRLLAVGGTGPTPTIGYTYDPAGNRIALTNAGTVTRFVVDPNPVLSRVLIRIRPGVTNYYVYGLGLLYEITETATNSYQRYYHYDYRGSTVALTDGAGSVTDRIEYSAYGTITFRTGTTDTPFLFNGRYGVQTDPNGLLYMRARYYNPYICRFINPDPIGFAGGLNWYAYADGNPVNYLDPYGLAYGNPIVGIDLQYPSSPYAPGGAYYVPSPLEPDLVASFMTGVLVGAAMAGAVTLAAPAAVSGLTAMGMSASTASGVVTVGLGAGAIVGGVATTMDTCNKALAADWDAVAFNLGSLSGGALLGGAGGGRYISNKVSPEPSTVARSMNPFTADRGYGFVRHPVLPLWLDVWNYMRTGPTPSSGGGTAIGIAWGLSVFLTPHGQPRPFNTDANGAGTVFCPYK